LFLQEFTSDGRSDRSASVRAGPFRLDLSRISTFHSAKTFNWQIGRWPRGS